MKSDLSITLLHEHPEYLEDCAVLLSKQWKRSLSARKQSIEKSYKELPDSLLLLEETRGNTQVIGHSRLTRVVEDPNGCWIGSVLIAEEKRGLGYGKYLMKRSEEHAMQFGFSTVYLNTRDAQKFYEHLGYSYCEPVTMVAAKSNPLLNKGSLLKPITEKLPFAAAPDFLKNSSPNGSRTSQPVQDNSVESPPPPPPPPMPQSRTAANNSLSSLGQYWMKKYL